MTKLTIPALAALILAGSSAGALADKVGADWMPIGQVIQKVEAAGYTQISEIEADDGHWEGEGMKDGKPMKFKADPRTGAILSEKAGK
ncbi:peptidase [Methylobacterium indicum]|uniref:Peptidase n=1 Tax=Methylobacterium indicum TaxID=1775910 RepID=A0A0J6RUR9_9HYPH|nr:PepSY domain-containing protein [Methylobacterium indicum]KMO23988.1 peptidase [Methylobacterium indicum]KMO24982.1 peptidase [Methylobacterium indicum]KTS35422.1 peptidase [Methylobacterium indicum]KTS42101.1 peptidase [Methylobacterium indicum]KTS50112.1 peptidase [Methylobacterium indicum]